MYQPAAGHRIIVRRTPGNHARVGVMTGLVLDVLTVGGVAGVLHFKCDQGGTVYLATNEQEAEIGVTQTIERLPDDTDDDEPENECERGDCSGIHRSPDGYRDCDGQSI
jgi:hypothetical protein